MQRNINQLNEVAVYITTEFDGMVLDKTVIE